MVRWYDWLYEMKKRDEVKRNTRRQSVAWSKVLMDVQDFCTQLPSQRRGEDIGQVLKREEEDAKPLARCEEKSNEWAKHWQWGKEVQNQKD